jgi:hypothetical protein
MPTAGPPGGTPPPRRGLGLDRREGHLGGRRCCPGAGLAGVAITEGDGTSQGDCVVIPRRSSARRSSAIAFHLDSAPGRSVLPRPQRGPSALPSRGTWKRY